MRIACLRGMSLLLLTMTACSTSPQPDVPRTPPRQDDPQVRQAIGKAVDFLVAHQERDGSWKGGNELNRYDMTATALSALALMASGDPAATTRKAVRKASAWIVNNIDGDWRVWDFAFAGIFLAETARTDPSDDVKSAMRSIARTLIFSRRHGGWGHQSREVFAYPSTMVSATNWAFCALLEMKNVGVEIDDEHLKIAAYYRKTQHTNGGLIYGYPTSHGGPEPGRTAMALYDLRQSGESDSDVYARGLPYVRRIRDDGKLIGMGGQMDYLQGALFSHALGDEDWEAYRSRYFPRILRALAEKRFWRLPSGNEKDHDPNFPSWTEFWTNQDWYLVGPYYTIALFTLALEVPDARLNLFRRE